MKAPQWLVRILKWVLRLWSAYTEAERQLDREERVSEKEDKDTRNAEAKKKLREAFLKGAPKDED